MAGARSIIVLGTAALLAVEALRVAAVTAAADQRFVSPARLWPSHPAVLIDQAMALVGQSARLGKGVPDDARALLARAASTDPLAPEPFLVEGARAEMDGQPAVATRLFEAAKARDPRGGAARYFLAGRYLAAGRPAEALTEMSAMARLVPGVEDQFVPSLVAFARQPAAVPVLRQFLGRSPSYRPKILAGLATDAANADLILRLAVPRAPGAPDEAWQSAIVTKLIETGQTGRAQAAWRRLAGVAPYDGVFNPAFAAQAAPPPFDWAYDNKGAGLVTPGPSGLEVIYYGRQDAILAEQMLVLAPGAYRLVADVGSSAPATALGWQLACTVSKAVLVHAPLQSSGITFQVPADGCAVQSLRLAGSSLDGEAQTNVTIRSVRIVRVGAP
ncbi:MAG: hypothetical protein ABIT69_00010 [Sphingomicrobium sp.]